MSLSALRQRPAWGALEKHYQTIRDWHLRQLFADDRERGERITIEAVGFWRTIWVAHGNGCWREQSHTDLALHRNVPTWIWWGVAGVADWSIRWNWSRVF